MAAVLIIEDETQVLILGESVLQHAGYETVTAIEPWILLIVFPPNCGQPKKERANLKQRQTIFGSAPLMRKNGCPVFTVKCSRCAVRKTSSDLPSAKRNNTARRAPIADSSYSTIVGNWTIYAPCCRVRASECQPENRP